jgi:DNA repair exonuclease SbcCD ATPase subunit
LQELTEKLGQANRKFSELEVQSMKCIAELRQANAGLTAKSEALERRVAESMTDYKQELQSLEGKFLKASKEYRADAEARIERLEGDISSLQAKVLPIPDCPCHLQVSY